jgi:retron-type reverse transcriptase
MKRHNGLWEELASFANLACAARQARRGKRLRPNVARFEFHLERELCRLQDELRSKTYRPGEYYTFRIFEPKPRLISAAPYRDRIVHHALCRVLEPLFEPTFISDSYACRKGKGSHAAVDRFQQFARRFPYVLKCDVRQYFPSLDHTLLKGLLRRKIKDGDVLWLADLIIDNANAQDPAAAWFSGDDLFAPWERRRGLPIGNQTSQFFANVYLNPFDHFVKETLRVKAYVRYVDDFVLFGTEKQWLRQALERCREFLATLRLRLHEDKSVISRTNDGVRFLGFRIFPDYRLLVRENVSRLKRRLRLWQRQACAGSLPENLRQRLMAWKGHADQANTFGLQRQLIPAMSCFRSA